MCRAPSLSEGPGILASVAQRLAIEVTGSGGIATVVLDLPLPHLDRPFDYAVPAELDDVAQPGVRVKVPFAGREVGGFVLARPTSSEHPGRLSVVRRVVSGERVLTPSVHTLARAVADRYAGSLSDVLRLAVPPRHARVEAEASAEHDRGATDDRAPKQAEPVPAGRGSLAWAAYPAGQALLERLAAGESPRAVWAAPPGPSAWAEGLAAAVAATLRSGRGAIVVVPDTRDLDTLDGALLTELGPGRHVRLAAELGPAKRYRAFLAALRGDVRVVIGTRAVVFAPVADLGLMAIWQDGDDVLAEPRAPYPHAREVLALRAEAEGAAVITAGWSRSVQAQQWVESGWARAVDPRRETARAAWPRVTVAGEATGRESVSRGRLPEAAWAAIRDGLAAGPVLVQAPRSGYVPGLACQTCRGPARCATCQGPLAIAGRGAAAVPGCGWCGREARGWACPRCEGTRLRAQVVGAGRTAEELGRGFPGAAVVVPRAGEPAPRVPDRAIVVATPGLEVPVDGGYASAVLLDGGLMLAQPRLRAGDDALLRWRSVAALVRPSGQGGVVVVCAESAAPPVQALVRGDPAWHAARELAERRALHLPPAATIAELSGTRAAVEALVKLVEVDAAVEVYGPLGEIDEATMTLKAPKARSADLTRALHAATSVRSARREPEIVRVRIDPIDI